MLPRNNVHFKCGQKWSENNHFSSFTKVQSKSMINLKFVLTSRWLVEKPWSCRDWYTKKSQIKIPSFPEGSNFESEKRDGKKIKRKKGGTGFKLKVFLWKDFKSLIQSYQTLSYSLFDSRCLKLENCEKRKQLYVPIKQCSSLKAKHE